MKPEQLTSLEFVYVSLLMLPHGVARLRLQVAMCELRDLIAEEQGRPACDVADDYQERALIAQGRAQKEPCE